MPKNGLKKEGGRQKGRKEGRRDKKVNFYITTIVFS